MKFLLVLYYVALLIAIVTTSPARFRRQWIWSVSKNSIPPAAATTTTTTTTSTTTTTASPTTNSAEYMECIKNCPSTQEYNPVCGSNRVTYDNPNKLRCAVACGAGCLKNCETAPFCTILMFRYVSVN